ncbi:MAG: FAD-dependent oxidoreductase [Rhizobiaceae bacterium]
MLADPAFANKCAEGRSETINTCIACNQACLDRVFIGEVPSCLVNPRALREIEYFGSKAATCLKVAVVGAGAAGLTMAAEAAKRGHKVTLFEQSTRLGGLLNLASRIPDKTEFGELLRYLKTRIANHGVVVQLNASPMPKELAEFDEVIIATGVRPRLPNIDGIDHPNVVFYNEILSGKKSTGKHVAVIGSGGIGFDVSEFLIFDGPRKPEFDAFAREFGMSKNPDVSGSLATKILSGIKPACAVTMLQRSSGKSGNKLSLTSRWIKRQRLHNAGVKMLSGVTYRAINNDGLHVEIVGEARLIEADTIVICAGQVSNSDLAKALDVENISYRLIGDARQAGELDAMRAIEDATRLAMDF